jgi:putative membrane protein insertion efficiency factor
MFQTCKRLLNAALSAIVILPVRFYQIALGPMLPKVCRYHPSCSVYFIEAVKKHGACVGSAKGIWRLCRCGPWTQGGYDPP